MIEENKKQRRRNRIRHLIIFAMFGAMMFALKVVMASLPNIHPIGMFIMLLTVVTILSCLTGLMVKKLASRVQPSW